MTPEERKAAIESLKEICREIGCSGLNPDMCNNRPHHCSIIRKLVVPANKVLHADMAICEECKKNPALDGCSVCAECGL